MAAKGDNAPVIIKRKKVIAAGGHHGGAWKVAYADFVTAMMAFFLLMWLLNATTETQRKGIADYFSPTFPVNRVSGGGDGAFGGDSVFTEEVLSQVGTGASMKSPADANAARGSNGASDGQDGTSSDAELSEIEDMLSAFSGESTVSELMQRHIVTRITDEGLIVELRDLPDSALFMGETDEPSEIMVELLTMLVEVFGIVGNPVAINGHTRARALVVLNNPVWELSTARADSVRKTLSRKGLEPGRVRRVTGFADRKPASGNPMAEQNNRIEVILLREKV